MLMNRSYNVLLRNEKSNNYNDFFEKQKNNTGAQCKIIDSISPAVMKPFNLFPVAREMLAIINTQYILYTYRCTTIVPLLHQPIHIMVKV